MTDSLEEKNQWRRKRRERWWRIKEKLGSKL
jgi:hypothetical protein